MANDISKVQLPLSVVTEVVKKAKDASTIAALCPSKPKLFADDKHLVFNPTAEAEVVAEGAKKDSYEIDLNPIEGKRFKVVTTTHVSDELKWADEDNKLEIVSNIIDDQGLSPHARGARTTGGSALPLPGIIPACAGSTKSSSARGSQGGDYPRMRGEHHREARRIASFRGSSPHARGALLHLVGELGPGGIIPACAGSTQRCHGARQDVRDHPRMRGEHILPDTSHALSGGSSPHARGALDADQRRRVHAGIIPACAGSTHPWRRLLRRWRDHPRMRGEHVSLPTDIVPLMGSSPHARGAPMVRPPYLMTQGIISACAGSTSRRNCATCGSGDHPRMRGEHSLCWDRKTPREGSSPHARGALLLAPGYVEEPGIIPACAGSTSGPPCRQCRRGDHPRMRGEHCAM